MNINELKKEAIQVLEKRTWIRKGIEDLITKINSQLEVIPDSDEKRISFTVREWKTSNKLEYTILNCIDLDLVFDNDAALEIHKGTSCEGNPWEYEEQKYYSSLSIESCRAIAEKLPETFQKYLDILKERKTEYDSTIAIIEKLKNRLANELKIETIESLSVGDYAEYDGDIMMVKSCVHGNKYYSYLCDASEKLRKLGSIEPVKLVDDAEEHYISACCR